jgi:glycerol-3-phosphate dehydrogenase
MSQQESTRGTARGIGPATRARSLDRFGTETFDACVVGGGITGAGIALELSVRGCSVALMERGDFASGASSRSSKLVHGGLRYLAHGDVGLCREAAREREGLLRDAPFLVRPIRFLYPIRRGGRSGAVMRAGLSIYDFLGGVAADGRHETLTATDAAILAPPLRGDGLLGACAFGDAMTDDASLVLAVIEQAVRRGAAVANHVRAVELLSAGGRLRAVEAIDTMTGSSFQVRARGFVNATGTSAADLAELAGCGGPRLRPSKGVHLVVPAARLPIACAVVFPGPDGRELFAVPRGTVVLVGTTDTPFDAEEAPPTVNDQDVDYLLSALGDAFDAGIEREDVVGAFAGLRPLLDGGSSRSADLSRHHSVHVGATGLLTIAGGKLTTFRRMARDAADALGVRRSRLAVGLQAPDRQAVELTHRLAASIGLGPSAARRALSVAGDRAPELLQIVREDVALGKLLVPGLPPLTAEAVWAIRAQMAISLTDVLDRRLGLALTDREAGLDSHAVDVVAEELGRDRTEAEIPVYAAAVRRERGPVAQLPNRAMESRSGAIPRRGWGR